MPKNDVPKDVYFMKAALKEAKKAARIGEVPVGAVIEYKGKLYAKGYNKRICSKDPTAHAELVAIKKAAKKLGDWRLKDMTLYVTTEPCLMCCGAIIHSRLKRVVYGCVEPKMGAIKSLYNVFNTKAHHLPVIECDVLSKESIQLLKDFFKQLRQN